MRRLQPWTVRRQGGADYKRSNEQPDHSSLPSGIHSQSVSNQNDFYGAPIIMPGGIGRWRTESNTN